jgi:predicted alpha/beta hydrolase
VSEPGPAVSEYTVEYLDRGTDRIGLHVYPSPADDTAPVAVVWPAMGTPARYYRHLAAALGEAGLGVVVVDLRGTGTSTPAPSRRSRYGYAELTDDVGAVLEALKSRLDGRPALLVGHSLGGQVCLLHLARTNPGTPAVAGLVLVAVGLPWWRSYGRKALSTLALTQWIVAATTLLRVWPGWGFGGRQSRRVIQDWGYTARRGRFPRLDGDDIEGRLASVRTPVLALSVSGDQYTPPATTDHLCTKLTTAPVRRVHLEGSLDHFTWARTPAAVVDQITAFARLHRPGGA